jgi:hypothetical protein
MTELREYKLPLATGTQTIRLEADSLDYEWRGGFTYNFRGRLPYENLRLKTRVTRRIMVHRNSAIIVGGLFAFVLPLLRYPGARLIVVGAAVAFSSMILHLIIQHRRGSTISVQIDPQPFGFRGELSVPNSNAGLAFLDDLEAAWKFSLRRRFLDRGVDDDMLQKRISWLEFIGALTPDEAAAERGSSYQDVHHPLIEASVLN